MDTRLWFVSQGVLQEWLPPRNFVHSECKEQEGETFTTTEGEGGNADPGHLAQIEMIQRQIGRGRYFVSEYR